MTDHANVSVVSAKEVVSDAWAIVEVPFVTGVQLGFHALSLSILKLRFCVGVPTFLSAALNVVNATQLPKIGIDILVSQATRDIFSALVARENVVIYSKNVASFTAIDCQA